MKKMPKFHNRRASYDYELHDTLECGIVLVGTEVKSLRTGKCHLDGSWVKVDRDELWLIGCDIPEYPFGNLMNHVPKQDRKLLVRKRELEKFAKKSLQKGFTLIPLSMYFNERGKVKVEIAVARGKHNFDKRESIKERDLKRH